LNSEALENLNAQHLFESDKFPILIFDDPQFMRGHNYRSKDGITLFLCRAFKTDRDVLQAKGRVGRYGDPCDRYTTLKSLVDRNLKCEYLSTLNAHLTSLSQ